MPVWWSRLLYRFDWRRCDPKQLFAIICKILDCIAMHYNTMHHKQCSAMHYRALHHCTILYNIFLNVVQHCTPALYTIGSWALGELKDYDEKTDCTDLSAFNSTREHRPCLQSSLGSCSLHISSAEKSTPEIIFAKFRGGAALCITYHSQSGHCHQTWCAVCVDYHQSIRKSLPRVNIRCWQFLPCCIKSIFLVLNWAAHGTGLCCTER